MIKVALIGIGGMGKVHFDAYKDVKNAQVIAVCDVREEIAREKVDIDNVNIYTSFDELLEKEVPDMIDICTPSYMHVNMAVKALEKGFHVLCEKPMSISSENTRKVIEAAEKSGKLFMTAHVVRFMMPYMYLKSVIDSKELGKPVHIEMTRLSGIPTWSWEDWMRDTSKSGGAVIDLSIHDIDYSQYVFGEPKDIIAVHQGLKNDNEHISVVLCYDGFSVTITGGWFSGKYPFKAEYTAIFEDGYIEYKNGEIIKNGETVELDKGTVTEAAGINLSGSDGYFGEIEYFIDCIINNKKPEAVTPESSEKSVKLVEEILAKAVAL